jgi:hypothetical protein
MTTSRHLRIALLRLARTTLLVAALGLVTACGVDGEPESPTRGDVLSPAVPSR